MQYNGLMTCRSRSRAAGLQSRYLIIPLRSMNEVSLKENGPYIESSAKILALNPEATKLPEYSEASGSDGSSGKLRGCILVVDDRRDIRFLAQHFIQKAGGTVVTADDGQIALNMLQEDATTRQIDLVLMDMQMPVMDGYEAVKLLRSCGFDRPIIALTANAMREDRERCLAVGCNDYASKPLDGVKLVRLISRYLG